MTARSLLPQDDSRGKGQAVLSLRAQTRGQLVPSSLSGKHPRVYRLNQPSQKKKKVHTQSTKPLQPGVFFNFFFKILFIPERERERNINVWLPLCTPNWEPGLQLRHMPTGNRTCDPSVRRLVLNEPYQPGPGWLS